MNTPMNRRAALAGALAAFPAIAGAASLVGPPAAAAADPIFVAIGRHKTAWTAFVETVDSLNNVEGEQGGSEEEVRYMEANAAANDALEAFLATPPMTLAGLRAALEYVVEVDSGCMLDNGGRIAETLLRSPALAA
jgi:hypothetical protein